MLCGVCSAAMLMGAVTFSASAAHPFTDVKGDQWYANFVDYAYNHGLMAGTSSSTFSPNQTMTRGMLVTVIHAIAGKPAPTTGNHFADVKANDYFAHKNHEKDSEKDAVRRLLCRHVDGRCDL